ncbi:MAG: glycosyltransferase family 4 protein [Terriglobia bacterium]
MRIGIDALSVIPNVVGGSETYIRELLCALLTVGSEDEFVVFLSPTNQARFDGLRDRHLRKIVVPFPSVPRTVRAAGQQLLLPRILKEWNLDVCHYPGSTMTLRSPCPGVVTIQSLHCLLYPDSFSFTRKHYLRYMTTESAKRAAALIVPSQDTREAVVRALGVPPDKVFVVPEGIRGNSQEAGGPDGVKRFGLESGLYILCPCHFLPYKNIETLVRAFHIVKSRYPVPHKLVVAGARVHRKYHQTIQSLIRSLGLQQEFLDLGMVPCHDMGVLYKNATMCVYPSLCETFGLPVLEAMASGTPVICSNRGALPEVAGKAAFLVDPKDFLQLSHVIHQLLSNSTVRKMLVSEGWQRVRQFGWDTAARKTLEVFRRVSRSTSAQGGYSP